jgi:hypothetical protein
MAAITPRRPRPVRGTQSDRSQGKARTHGSPQGRPDSKSLSLPGSRLLIIQMLVVGRKAHALLTTPALARVGQRDNLG